MNDPAHVALMLAVAKHFFGKPNKEYSNQHEWRFRNRGSMKVDLKKGLWHDFEVPEGGGPIKLIKRELKLTSARECYQWAEQQGYWHNGKANANGGRTIVAVYDYADENGTLLFQKVRYEPKWFSLRRPDGNGGWIWKRVLDGVRRVVYHLAEVSEAIANDHLILIVEGEKGADNCWRIGIPATCNYDGGSRGKKGKWRDEFTPFFAGANIIIVADNDEVGRAHVCHVAAKLHPVAKRVRILDLAAVWPQCPPKGDISDWIAAGGTVEQLYEIIEKLPDWRPPQTDATASATATPSTPLFDPWARYIVPAFPFEILPPVVQDFAGAEAVVIGGDPSAMAMCTLGAFSGALHHGIKLKMLRNGRWRASPRLWILLVAPVSHKKTPTFNAVLQPLVDYEAHLRAEYQIALHEYENAKENGDKKGDQPRRPPRYLSWDMTIEKLGEILTRGDGSKSILIPADELSGWIGFMERYSNSKGRSERAFWLKAYDGGPYGTDRIDRGDIYIPNLSVSILGGIQPERLRELHGLTSDGLLQRFIPVIGAEPTFRLDQVSHYEAYGNLVRRMIATKPGSIIMTDDALAVMESLHRHHFDLALAARGLDPGCQTFVGKLDGVAGSLALNLHMATHLANNPHDQASGIADPVQADTIDNVRRLVVDFILPHAREFYYGTATTSGEKLQRIASCDLRQRPHHRLRHHERHQDCRGLSVREV